MEHRRRTLSSAFDDDIIDIEKQVPRRRGTSASIDERQNAKSEILKLDPLNKEVVNYKLP
jgi:hypothetical protein